MDTRASTRGATGKSTRVSTVRRILNAVSKAAPPQMQLDHAPLDLFDYFSVEGVLGRGSFATVYLVRRLLDGSLYALKHTDISALHRSEWTGVLNEVRLLASLQYPGITRFYEAFEDHGQLFLVTEQMPGGDLGAMLRRRDEKDDPLPEKVVWSYFIQLLLALRYMHHCHVLHGDIKPGNVLLDCAEEVVKLSDLGISQILNGVFTRAKGGTSYYLSPEMWRGEAYSYSADIWALGCLLFECCSLTPMFYAESELRAKNLVLSGRVELLPQRYSMDLGQVLYLMMRANPADRPTADEILMLPQVQSHLHLLPKHLLPWTASLEDGEMHVERPTIQPLYLSSFTRLNEVLPPAQYDQGPGVIDSLRTNQPDSHSDFAGTAALALQQAARRTSAEGPQPWPGGGDGKSSPPMKLRRSKSVSVAEVMYALGQERSRESLMLEVEEGRPSSSGGPPSLGRRSVMVGEVQHLGMVNPPSITRLKLETSFTLDASHFEYGRPAAHDVQAGSKLIGGPVSPPRASGEAASGASRKSPAAHCACVIA